MKVTFFSLLILISATCHAAPESSLTSILPTFSIKKIDSAVHVQERDVNRFKPQPESMTVIETKLYKEFFSRKCALGYSDDVNANGC